MVKRQKKISTAKMNLSKSNFPKHIQPQLATLVDLPPEGKQWLHEIKYDGYRIIAYKDRQNIQLITRNQNDLKNKFTNIYLALQAFPVERVIFDGEIVLLDKNGHPNFQLLQNSLKNNNIKHPFIYYIFDLLYYDHYNLMNLSLIERKKILKKILKNEEESVLCYSDHFTGNGNDVYQKVCQLGLEGIIAKDKTAKYIQKRSHCWLKIKCIKHQEFIVCGFTAPKGQRAYFGSLVLGAYNKRHELIYHGNVGTGFTEDSLRTIYDLLKKFITSESPFKQRLATEHITWVTPALVVEVAFSEWTQAGILRHPSFKGIRNDRSPKQTTLEPELFIENVVAPSQRVTTKAPNHFTNLTKILYPEANISKKQLLAYYEQVNDWMLPYISLRPLTLLRCPHGYQHCFYQRHLNKTMPHELYGITVKEEKKEKCIYIKNNEGLLALVQLAALEIHPWNSQINNIEYPDMIIFDLDPAPDVAWKQVVTAAVTVKQYLSYLHLTSFVKTTGGKGLHVVIPIKAEYTWDEVKLFTQLFAKYMEKDNSDLYISTMNKTKRKGKIFIDYLRNQRGATAIAPYSTRARPHAPVAMPLDWDELTDDINDTFFTIHNAPQRLKDLRKDPWSQFFSLQQSLNLDFYSN